MKLSFVCTIAYDFQHAFKSILSYYEIADEIILGLDKDRISWSKHGFDFDSKVFFDWINLYDSQNKIKVYEDNFHKSEEPMENEVAERNYLSKLCKEENYIVSIDSDEVILNQKEFLDWMINKNVDGQDIKANWITIYKVIENKAFVTLPHETVNVGTNLRDNYKKGRITSSSEVVLSPLKILHFSWGRTREQLIQKLQNFGHSKDFNIYKQVDVWDSINLNNYSRIKNFHPLNLKQWWTGLELLDLNSFNLK